VIISALSLVATVSHVCCSSTVPDMYKRDALSVNYSYVDSVVC